MPRCNGPCRGAALVSGSFNCSALPVNSLVSALEHVGPHDHLCSIYQTDADRLSVALPFLRIGLGRGEKCVYVGDDGGERALGDALAADGVDGERLAASGARVLRAKQQAYLRGGRFEPEQMIAFWQREAAVARGQGYSGMRGAGESDWIAGDMPGIERWLEYEARLTDAMAQCACMILCQYNRARYPTEVLLGILQTHPLVLYDGAVCRNHYYAPAAELLPSGQSEQVVERWLHNIREHERVGLNLRRSQELLERKQADLQHAHRRLTAEFGAMTRLHELSCRLMAQGDLQKVLDEVLEATMTLQKADLGNIQLHHPETGTLEIAAQRGFAPGLLDQYRTLDLTAGGARGDGPARRERLIIEDVQSDPAFVAYRDMAARVGFRALQCTPLIDRGGRLLGVISTDFRAPHRPTERDLRMTDLYARQAADLIERKRAEQALRQSEERFRLMVDGVTDYAIFMLDGNGRVVSWNAGAQHIKGYSTEEAIGRHFALFYSREAVAQGVPQKELAAATRDGRFAAEGWRLRKGGARFWASVLVTEVHDDDGHLVGFSLVTRDLSEARRAEDRVRQADERNALILDAITDLFFAFTKDFRFAHFNRHAAKQISLLGKDPEPLIGKLLWDEFPDSPNAATLRRVMRERVPLTDEEYYAPLGEWYENRIYPSNDGGLVVFSRNVTDRKRGEQALRRSEAYLEAGQRISHTASWGWNAVTGELFWSAEHFRIMGLDPQSVRPTYEMFFERVHPDDRAAVQQAFETAVRERRNFAGSYRVLRPDGSIRHIRSEAQPIMDESQTMVEYIGTVVDVTERKQGEEAVRKAREELAHVNRALTVAELTASIAHELNQPLAAVVTNANACERWLAAKPPNDAEAHAALRRITRDANRATQAIADSRSLLTRGEAQKAELSLEQLIADVLSLVESDARHKEIALSAHVDKDLPVIRADRVRIQQVLLNLLLNAMDVLGPASPPPTLDAPPTRDADPLCPLLPDSRTGPPP